MYFICTEKCELLHLATRTHMKLCVHLTHTIRLNVDQFFFSFSFYSAASRVFVCFFNYMCALHNFYVHFFPFRCRTFCLWSDDIRSICTFCAGNI